MRFNPVLDQAGVDPQVGRVVAEDLLDRDGQVSPALFVTVQRPGSSASRHGGDIQFSGL